MDYEKKYKEALERARVLNNGEDVDIEAGTTTCEYIFPELKESEDERIRKEIEYIIKTYRDSCIDEGSHKFDECLAWLEKQGEQNSAKWSEEDEGELYLTIWLLDKFKEKAYTNDCENCINWLKSLKPQSHWKPTEEQLQTLEETIEYDAADANVVVLRTLINDLKKL